MEAEAQSSRFPVLLRVDASFQLLSFCRLKSKLSIQWLTFTFANEFELEKIVRFETEVVNVRFVEDNKKWKVRFKQKRGDNDNKVGFDFDEEIYDAVVVCKRHYTEPHVGRNTRSS